MSTHASAFFVQKNKRIMMMVLKFNNVDQLDNQLNKQMLADYRDQTCSTKDIVDSFNMIAYYKQHADKRWQEVYIFLKQTIARLQEHGCDVSMLNKTFKQCEEQMLHTNTNARR